MCIFVFVSLLFRFKFQSSFCLHSKIWSVFGAVLSFRFALNFELFFGEGGCIFFLFVWFRLWVLVGLVYFLLVLNADFFPMMLAEIICFDECGQSSRITFQIDWHSIYKAFINTWRVTVEMCYSLLEVWSLMNSLIRTDEMLFSQAIAREKCKSYANRGAERALDN